MKAGAMSVFLHFLETTSSFDQKGNFPTLKILCSLGLLLQQLMLTSPRPSMAKGPGPERTEKENRCDFAHSELGDLFPLLEPELECLEAQLSTPVTWNVVICTEAHSQVGQC